MLSIRKRQHYTRNDKIMEGEVSGKLPEFTSILLQNGKNTNELENITNM